MASKLRIALDQNFPEPILRSLGPWMPEAELCPARSIHPDLPKLDDHEVVRVVAARGFDLLVSCDADYVHDAATVSAILQTGMRVCSK